MPLPVPATVTGPLSATAPSAAAGHGEGLRIEPPGAEGFQHFVCWAAMVRVYFYLRPGQMPGKRTRQGPTDQNVDSKGSEMFCPVCGARVGQLGDASCGLVPVFDGDEEEVPRHVKDR